MPRMPRIGIQIGPFDPFWVQAREVIWQRALSFPAELVEIEVHQTELLSTDEQLEVVEDLAVRGLDALLCNSYPDELLQRILAQGIPVVYVSECYLSLPLLTSRLGLFDAAAMLGVQLRERLPDGGSVLVVGGGTNDGDDGHSRLDGFRAGLAAGAKHALHHVPCRWSQDDAKHRTAQFLEQNPTLAIDAVFGLSDSIALGAQEALHATRRPAPLLFGINGDPLALAAIAAGSMTATVETDVDDIALQSLELSYRAACGNPIPQYFRHRQHLVTIENVTEVATRKLITLASLPTRLVDVNQRIEQQRLVQLETSLAINRKVGLILDEPRLSTAITELIRDNYAYDQAQLWIWDEPDGCLVETGAADGADRHILPDPLGPLAYALTSNRAVFIPDVYASHRFALDPAWPATRARLVLPVRLGGQVIGLLDLQRRSTVHHTRQELDGLQLLADQLGIAVRNAELYGQAVAARASAEKADRLKTRLLANVSHELRTPIDVILGYSRTARDTLDATEPNTAAARRDLGHIQHSAAHLKRLIDDLLDLSRSEIDALGLEPELIDTRSFLEELFQESAVHFGADSAIAWRLYIEDAPPIRADPLRLRQVLLNLLHNAQRHTTSGQIRLGADASPTALHLWVADTGVGIAPELREQIFEPFASFSSGAERRTGIGLGLSIAQRLVALHGGTIGLESELGRGSTFHIYLPLNGVAAQPTMQAESPYMLLISGAEPPGEILQLADRRGLAVRRLDGQHDLAGVLDGHEPVVMAWDLATAATEGAAVLQQIRAHPSLCRLPMVLYHHAADAASGDMPIGATSLLLKPLSDLTLIKAIDDLRPVESGGTILIVEDDPQMRALHERLVTEHFPNYALRAVDGGLAALDVLSRETPSLIVLDLSMPDLDGFAVLEALRAEKRTSTVPVLIMSGMVLSAQEIRRLGGAHVVFHAKHVLSEGELAGSLARALTGVDQLPPQTSTLVKRAVALIQQQYDRPLSRQEIAVTLGVSKDYLGRIFQQELGLAPHEFLLRYRVLRAKELLHTADATIAEVAARVGFDDAAYFSRIFRREAGCSPRDYRLRR